MKNVETERRFVAELRKQYPFHETCEQRVWQNEYQFSRCTDTPFKWKVRCVCGKDEIVVMTTTQHGMPPHQPTSTKWMRALCDVFYCEFEERPPTGVVLIHTTAFTRLDALRETLAAYVCPGQLFQVLRTGSNVEILFVVTALKSGEEKANG